MRRRLVLCLLLVFPWPALARLAEPMPPGQSSTSGHDLADIRSRGVLRVLINQSRHSSGEIDGKAVGVEHQRLQGLQQYLNRGSEHPLTLKLIPKAKEQLLEALLRGEGDLVAPGELLNPRTGQDVSASRAIQAQVPIVLVSRKGARRYLRIEQLAGHSLALPLGSAADEAVRLVNQQLAERKLAPIMIEWVDPSLAVEDVLEMVQAGIYPLTAVEQPIAERWAKVLPDLRIDRHLLLGNRDDLRWFVRRDAPMLRASIDRFLQDYVSPENTDADFLRLNRRLYRVHDPLARADRQRLEKIRPVLQRFAEQNNLDWLGLAAVAFKESSLNPAARGVNGATGLMQITPSAAQHVGVSSVATLDNNVQAAAKYLALLGKRFFSSPQISEHERLAFSLAAYNMGPERVQGLRAEARRRGLNANQWFFQVERVAMDQVGMAPVTYVSSVNKYYLTFARERYALDPQNRALGTAKQSLNSIK